MKFDLTNPCADCPFRNDGKGIGLSPDRAEEISDSLIRSTFACHKTLDYSDDDGAETEHTQHCAGALILLEHEEQPSQMMRIAERLGLYDRTKLNMGAPVFRDIESFIDSQPY